tara:strand:+ start:416 stop:949 length:534 start_codon:yes stop_codon:yes gene_type:complete
MKQFPDELTIDYPALIDNAMRSVVKSALEHAARFGLPGDHHFFVSFLTQFPGVDLSPALMTRYPEEMTIVIQHQYWDLKAEADHFSLMLSFNNVPEKLIVPYEALTAFADPSIKFGLQFHTRDWNEEDDEVHCPSTGRTGREMPPEASFDEEPPSDAHPAANDDKVVSIDAWRNDKK